MGAISKIKGTQKRSTMEMQKELARCAKEGGWKKERVTCKAEAKKGQGERRAYKASMKAYWSKKRRGSSSWRVNV